MFAKKHTIGGIKMKNNLPAHVLGSMQSILDEIDFVVISFLMVIVRFDLFVAYYQPKLVCEP